MKPALLLAIVACTLTTAGCEPGAVTAPAPDRLPGRGEMERSPEEETLLPPVRVEPGPRRNGGIGTVGGGGRGGAA